MVLAMAGCEALVRPSREARIASAEAGEAHFGSRMAGLRRSVFYVYSSDGSLGPGFSADQGRFSVSPRGGIWSSALASGISGDGYLITAGHVVKRYNWVVGWMNGGLSMLPARVVEKRDYNMIGAEFAVLRVEAAIDSPLPVAAEGGIGAAVYAMAAERDGHHGVECLAGGVLGHSRTAGKTECLVLLADLPTWHGDSGGPVLSPDGGLIGVDVGWESPTLFSRPGRTVCCPNPAVIRSIIDRDREADSGPGRRPPPARPSATRGVRHGSDGMPAGSMPAS